MGSNHVADSQTVRQPDRVADSQTVRPGRQTARQSDSHSCQADIQTVNDRPTREDSQTIRPSDNQYPGSRQSYKNPEIQHCFCRSLRDPSQGPTKIILARGCLRVELSTFLI